MYHVTPLFGLGLLSIISISSAIQNITVEYNPGCNISSCFNDVNPVHLVYAKLQDEKSSVHYIISTIDFSLPTILLLKSECSNSELLFNWNKILSKKNSSIQGGIKFVDKTEKKQCGTPEAAVYLFSKIYGYSDMSNTVDINNPKSVLKIVLSLSDITWNVSYTNTSAMFNGTSHISEDFSNATWLALRFEFNGGSGRDPLLPRLAFSKGSSKLDFIINNFTANFSNPRYSLLVQVANPLNASFFYNNSNSGYVGMSTISSIDDEYAPAVFTTAQLKWRQLHSQLKSSHFWIWRTVCYTQSVHARKFSTDVKSSKMHVMSYSNSTQSPPSSNRVLLSYFGKKTADSFQLNSTVISFGNADDKFYSATHYLGWTSLIGLGVPPGDSFSLMVICVLLAGLGLPCLVIIGGALYLIIRKVKGDKPLVLDRSSYESIS